MPCSSTTGRPGFGHSERPRTTIWTPAAQAALIVKALAALEIDKPIVVGHSWGTLVALAAALDHPGAVAALVLVSGYYYPTARPDVALFSPPAVPILGDMMRFTVSPIVGRLATPMMTRTIFAPLPVPASFGAFPLEMSLRPSQIRATSADTAMMIPAAAELSGRYGDLAVPVVIVAGDGDLIAWFDDHAARLHDELAGSVLIRIEGAGHMVHYAAPERIVSAIDQAGALAPPSASAAAGEEIVPPPAVPSF